MSTRKCVWCNYSTNNNFCYKRHLETEKHKKNVNKFFNCENCGDTFDEITYFHEHQKTCIIVSDPNKSLVIRNNNTMHNNDTLYVNNSSVNELLLENEKLKLSIKYQQEVSEYKREKDIAQAKLETNEKFINMMFEDQINHKQIEHPSTKKQSSNSKKDKLDCYFGDTIDLDTFIDNYKNNPEFQLTFDESKILLDNFEGYGTDGYGAGLYYYLKKKYLLQVKKLTGKEPNEFIMPFITADSKLRNHYEKTEFGWKNTSINDKIKKLVIISNDQVYLHHKQPIILTPKQRNNVASDILRKSNFQHAEVILERKKNLLEFEKNINNDL